MYSMSFVPRFSETDAFGHINNTVLNVWFEAARGPLFEIFYDKNESLQTMNLILARTEVDFVAQIFYGHEVEVQTHIESIGNSSFVVAHEAYQKGELVAKGKAVQVHFDHDTQRSKPLTEELKERLLQL